MTAGSACGAGDFASGLSDVFKGAEDLVDQLRRGLKIMAAGQRRSSPWEHEFRRGGPSGHWGGGFVGGRGGWWPGPPGPPSGGRGQKASRGDVRAAILALLQEGPRNGYQIMSDIEERSNGAWRPSPGAVYPALSALADEGLITDKKSDGRRTFRLTDAGQAYVEENPEMARGAWESTAQQEAWQVPGLFAEAARLGAGIVQIAHAGDQNQVRAAERLLERTRRELYRILADEAEDAEENEGQE
jgi:DNA-binding PadR family transcriptional regulator